MTLGSYVATQAIAAQGVSVRYGDAQTGLLAVDDVSLLVAAGEWVSIVGPSGCGKSTLLRAIAGLQPLTAGRVEILGASPQAAQAGKRLGLVFQEPALLPWRDVEANVRLPLIVNKSSEPGVDRTAELLGMVGLEAFAHYRPHELSGGMQQRVALARALAHDPDLLLMDEPLASLDEITREQMRYELLRIWEQASVQRPKTVIFVTHSVAEAVALSDRVLVMSARPGVIKASVSIDLPRPRRPEHERDAVFLDYLDSIRGQLRDETAEEAGA
jgi:NitT/TauT family transport system ATP-binding protein